MPGLILFLSCTGLCAWRITTVLASREPEALTRIERGVWIGVMGFGIWLAQGHLLSLFGRFEPNALVITSLATLASVLLGSRRLLPIAPTRQVIAERIARSRFSLHHPIALDTVLPFALVTAVVIYSVAALLVLPVSNHDALAYHFPKAMELVTTRAFGLYPSQDWRIPSSPGNYELLVATILTFLHADWATGLITSGALLLFLTTSFTLFKRTWQDTRSAILAAAMMLASPVLFLHITAHKNDILMAAFTLNALLWLGRFAVAGASGSAIIGIVAIALAVGTKFHGLFVALAASILWWRAWRDGFWRPTRTQAALQFIGIASIFLLLGSVQYIANVAATGQFTGIVSSPTPNALNTIAFPAYWQVPRFAWMFLTAPLLSDGQYFTVPWTGAMWFWPAYELYFSHYGIHVSILILLLPLGVWWSRRHLEARTRNEVTWVSLAAAILVSLNALLGLRPYGGFAFIPRFLFFALPVLLVWTWCPAVIYISRFRRLAWLPVTASLLIPIAYINVAATKDAFTPFTYVADLWESPRLRRVIFHTSWRAASILDRIAPADAVVAIDTGYDGWTYPLFGASLSRRVEMILDESEPYHPPPQVDWVAIDHVFPIIWGHPGFQTMADARRYIDKGLPTDRDLRVYRSLLQDQDFKRIYFDPTRFQAIFRRVRPRLAATSVAGLD